MKYSLSCQHTLAALRQQADEIKIEYKDIQRIRDFATEDWNGTKDIVIEISNSDEVDWSRLVVYQEVLNITIACPVSIFPQARENNFTYYWAYPVSTYYELRGLIDFGVSQILIEAPLTHDLVNLKLTTSLPIRMCANRCYNDYMPHANGIVGSYIRPEDISVYEQYVSTIEFDYSELSQELTLQKIYKKGIWNGNLNLLINKLNYDIDNRGFELAPTFLMDDDETVTDKLFAERRISCAQKCQRFPHSCNFCNIMFNFITTLDKRSNNGEKFNSID